MAFSLFIIGIICIVGLMAYLIIDDIRVRRSIKQYKTTLQNKESELNKIAENEHQLRQASTELQAKLDVAAEDSVTELPGWKFFEDRLNQAIKESLRYQFTMGVLFIDIDDFKVINDALGFEVGNEVLLQCSKRLQSCIRQVDSISRYSKDTFVILLPQLGKPETAAIIAQRMLQELTQVFQMNGHELFITACIGIAIFPNDGRNLPELLRSAEHALHVAKKRGKNNYQFYQERMHISSLRELDLSTGIKKETISQEFVIHYQPVMNVQNQTVFCMDSLLYWQHPTLGMINPQELFDYAGRQGKLNVFSEWLLRNICRQFLYWRTLGFCPEMLALPIDIKQLENTNFIYKISQILKEMEFKPEWLLVKLHGNTALLSFNVMEKAFNMLNYMGVKLAIADFGARHFTLSDLKNFKFNYLILNQSLIATIEDDEQARAIVKSIVQLAQNLSLQLIVEGVETERQVRILNDLGCYLMQGQLIGSPMAEKEVISKMATGAPELT